MNVMPVKRFKQVGTGEEKKRLGKLRNFPKTPVWSIPQVNRFIGNR